jgi:hypothetical protein
MPRCDACRGLTPRFQLPAKYNRRGEAASIARLTAAKQVSLHVSPPVYVRIIDSGEVGPACQKNLPEEADTVSLESEAERVLE